MVDDNDGSCPFPAIGRRHPFGSGGWSPVLRRDAYGEVARKRSFTLVRSNSSCASWSGCSKWNTVSQRSWISRTARTIRPTPHSPQFRASKVYSSWWAVCCSRWVCSRAALPLSPRAIWRLPISRRVRQGVSSRCSMAGVSNRVLFRVRLSLGRRGWRMEPRSNTQPRIHIRRIAKPGVSRLGRRPPKAVENFRGAAGGAQHALRAMPEAGEAPSIPSPRGQSCAALDDHARGRHDGLAYLRLGNRRSPPFPVLEGSV